MTTWYPRDASAYRRPSTRGGAKALHRSNGEGRAICSVRITLCDDEPGMGHDDPPASVRCKRCDKMPTHKVSHCINCKQLKPCLLFEVTEPAELEEREDWASDSASRVVICRECLGAWPASTPPEASSRLIVASTLVSTLLDGLP